MSDEVMIYNILNNWVDELNKLAWQSEPVDIDQIRDQILMQIHDRIGIEPDKNQMGIVDQFLMVNNPNKYKLIHHAHYSEVER